MSKSGIVNVRMVITEEKMISNIDKIQKLINPKSKKMIVELDEDAYFKDLIESVKSYLIEYPNKKNFPASVYKSAYNLVEYATSQFEENTKEIEELIRQRETNIGIAGQLKEALEILTSKEEDWIEKYENIKIELPEDIIETLAPIEKEDNTTEEYQEAIKQVNAKIVNLESNLHIEIDMERIEDRSKALSYIGIEIADALKLIPTPREESEVQKIEETKVEEEAQANEKEIEENNEYLNETRFEVKKSLWQKIKQSKLGRAIRFIFKAKVVLDVPALPEAGQEKND